MKQLNTALSTLSRSLMLGVVMLLPVSCIEDSMDKSATGEGMVPINLTISPKAVSTRTATTDIQSAQLASGQTFYAYFTSADVVPRSTTFTADGAGGTTPASQPYFKLSETSTGVRAYYPSSVTEATTSFTVEANQSGDDAYRASDLMFASSNITKVFPASTGALTFAHKMAKIRVNVTVNAGVSVSSVKLKNIKRQAPFTASTGAMGTAVSSGSTDVTMFTSAGETSNFSCVALVPPQSAAANATLITVTTANHTLVYEVPSAVTFASGYQYVYNVSVFDSQLIVTTNITAWDTTPADQAGQGTLNRPKLPIEYIAPYNMQTATLMATDNNADHSGYFCWNESPDVIGGVGTPSDWTHGAKDNIKAMIRGTAVPGYHMPSKAEWCSIMAPYFAQTTDRTDMSMGGETGTRIKYKLGSKDSKNLVERVVWGVKNDNGTYTHDVNRDFYNDYYCPADLDHVGYGLRFKESTGNGQYTCAYRYEYKTSDDAVGGVGRASLTVQVIYVGANPNITIDTISDEDWWTNPEYTVVLPCCGFSTYTNHCDILIANSYSNDARVTSKADGCYWAATAMDASKVYHVALTPTAVVGNHRNPPGHGFSVRLFKDAN